MGKTILLTGRPRVGKTTIVKEVVKRLPGGVGGFYTEEIKERGQRQGFKIVTSKLSPCSVASGMHMPWPWCWLRFGIARQALLSVSTSKKNGAEPK